jgi:hypothetical protein
MKATRKQKLKQRAEKQQRADDWKRASLSRLLNAMGLTHVFAELPLLVRDMFLEHYLPGAEVIAAEDSRDAPEIQAAVRDIKRVIKRPWPLPSHGIHIALAFDDVFRGYQSTIYGIKYFRRRLQGTTAPRALRVLELLDEALQIIDDPEENWVRELNGELMDMIFQIRDRTFRVDGRMVSLRFIPARKPEGRSCDRFVLRLQQAQPRVIPVDGQTRKAYPCCQPWAWEGIKTITWNCAELGIASSKAELPVFIEKHAIARLEERIPLFGRKSLLHSLMVGSLHFPVLTPRGPDKYLVEICLSEHKVGYLVAQVLPDLVLVRTFLFLTMQGTPEADRLREKLGLSRNDVERYKLDHFWTLTATNIADDPLLSRLLAECGCSHLLSFLQLDVRVNWLERHGEKMKELHGLREAKGGFMVGQKWVRWSDETAPVPSVD